MKETYQNVVKQRCRKHFRKFIKRHLNRPHNAKVLCFPGHECLEIFEVYDKLGVRRENIYCLERDKKVAAMIAEKNLGVKLIVEEFNDFIKNTDVVFDIVSLDFMGQLGTFEDAIFNMHARGLIADHAVVFTNFCGARESSRTKRLYENQVKKNASEKDRREEEALVKKLIEATNVGDEDAQNKIVDELEKRWASPLNKPVSETRDEAVHMALREVFMAGVGTSPYQNLATKEIKIEEEHEDPSTIPEGHVGIGSMLVRTVECKSIIERLLSRKIKNIGADLAEMMVENLHVMGGNIGVWVHDIHGAESYKYVGDNGMPMFADVFHLKKWNEYERFSQYVDKNADTLEGFWRPLFELPEALLHVLIYKIMAVSQPLGFESKCPARVHLGNESEYHPEVKVLAPEDQKSKAIELIQKNPGISTDQVSLLTGAPSRRVAAWKAHVTMGTYK